MACRCRRSRPTAPASASFGGPGGARRLLRRLALVASLGATAASLVKRRRARDAAELRPSQAPEWPPLVDPAPAVDTGAGAVDQGAVDAGAAPLVDPAPWVDPVDGVCPLTHPVKGNASSRIYHEPGSRFYEMTIPERCYRDAAAAEDDGMRAPKR
jgi:hypothetical protein